MRKLNSILLATDLRSETKTVVEVANQLAAAFDSQITLLHVVEEFPKWESMVKRLQQQAMSRLRELGEELIEKNLFINEPVVRVGSPRESILEEAARCDPDLILIGAGNFTSRENFSVGPVAESILQLATQPVLAVRPGSPALHFRKLLCPIDQSGASQRGLRNAVHLAKVFGGELVALSVVPDVSWLGAVLETKKLQGAKEEHHRMWEREFENSLRACPFSDLKATTELREGVPHRQILQAARDHNSDLLIMGATGNTGIVRALLGGTTRRVMQDLSCSLLVVKEEDLVEELFEGDLRTIETLLTGGRELSTNGDHEGALTKYRQILVRNPFHVGAVLGMRDSYQQLGDKESARYYERRAQQLQEPSWN